MENSAKKNNPTAAILSVSLLAVGSALLGYSLYMLPAAPAYGFPWAFAGSALSFIAIAVGGWNLNLTTRRCRNDHFRHGQDGGDGAVMLALFAIVAGALLLCFNNGVLPMVWRGVFFSWQMLLITIGAIELARGRFIGGCIMVAIGGYFIIRRLVPIYPDISGGSWTSYWPVLLILLGVLILGGVIFRPRGRRSRCHHGHADERRCGINGTCGEYSHMSGIIDISVVFGSNEQVYLDPVFQGGKISTVFGGVTLDLRRTELPEGETLLKVKSLFGGLELYAPEGWDIEMCNESVFGGFADKRLPAVRKTYDDGRKLIIRASSVFGGGEIK